MIPLNANTIRVRRNGPLLCTGDVAVYDTNGVLLQRGNDLVLCRCGGSQNKPFCDGSHKAIAFTAAGLVVDEKPEMLEDAGPLELSVRSHAMLIVKGPVTIQGSEGGSTTRMKAALCRCGHSQKKPFCDVSHKKCDFVAD